MEYAKITLLIPLTDDATRRPDKWNWTSLVDHNSTITVVADEYLTEDEARVEFADHLEPEG